MYICPLGDWSPWGYNPRQAMLEGLQSPITLTCPRGYNPLGQFLELAWIIFTINNAMSVCIFQCPYSDCSCPLLALMRWVGGETISCSRSYLSQVSNKLIPNKCASSVYILRKLFLLVDQCQQRQYCLSISCWIAFDMMRTCLHRAQRVMADALG